jgi:hypothetical protein
MVEKEAKRSELQDQLAKARKLANELYHPSTRASANELVAQIEQELRVWANEGEGVETL